MAAYYFNDEIETITLGIEREAWGIFDEKGREFGMRIILYTIVVHEGEAPAGALQILSEPGKWFVANARTTRDGKVFGAYVSSAYFRTQPEAEKYLSTRMQRAHARAKKQQQAVI